MLEEININHMAPSINLKISLRSTLNFWHSFLLMYEDKKEKILASHLLLS